MRRMLLVLNFALGAASFAAPVPKEWRSETIPPAPEPDETLFSSGSRKGYGIVLAIKETKITLRPMPSTLDTTVLPNGDVVQKLRPVDETPIAYFVHPVMKNGGLADQAAGGNGYRVKDLKVGDIASLHYMSGIEKSRWLVEVSIHDRDRKGPPPPFRTDEQWREIRWERMFARDARLKAKEDAAKNEKK